MIIVEDATTCQYCERADSDLYCANCDRALCTDCSDGLKCDESKCSKTPSGEGVR